MADQTSTRTGGVIPRNNASRAGSDGSRSSSSAHSKGSRPGSQNKPSSAEISRHGSAGSHSKPTKPSDKLNPKTIDPFSSKMSQSIFATVYNNGGIPCRLMHGSVKHKLSWNQPPDTLSFDPLLVTLAEGLKETVHPYKFVAPQAFRELLDTPYAGENVLPVLPRVIPPLRAALGHKDNQVFSASLECLMKLAQVTGPTLNPHLKNLLMPLSKRVMEKSFRDSVMSALCEIETYGGRDAGLVIKSKVPTYTMIP